MKTVDEDTQSQSWFDRRIYRSRREHMVGGVAGGLGTCLDIDPKLVRLLFVFLTLASVGIGLLVYVILWIIVPKAPLDEERGLDDTPRPAADNQPKVGSGYKKESEPINRDKLLRYAVAGVIILVILALIGSCGDLSESDVEDVEAAVPIHGLIDHHDRYNGKRVKVRGHVGSIGWEVWGGHQPGLSDFVLLGPLGGPHPNYAAFCRVDRSHVAEFRDLRQGQAVIVRGRYRYEEGTRPVELEDCRRVSE